MDNAPLHTLPPEIKRCILAFLDLGQLKRLIRASPVFLQQFLADRRYVLVSCLRNTLGSVFVDALFVHRTKSTTPDVNEILRVLDDYQKMRAEPYQTRVTEELSEVDAMAMLTFHINRVLPVVHWFIGWAVNCAGSDLGIPAFRQPLSPSRTEGTRFLRSLYRFQICCQFFGFKRFAKLRKGRRLRDATDILSVFFFLFEPWEVEEMSSLSRFADAVYRRVVKDFDHALEQGNVRIAGELVSPPINDYLIFPLNMISYLNRIAHSCGLEPLYSVLTMDRDDYAGLLETTISVISPLDPGSSVGDILSDLSSDDPFHAFTRELRKRRPPPERQRRQDASEPQAFAQPFEGDSPAGPPLAWTLLWGGTYCNIYNTLSDHFLVWACVMWDAERLNGYAPDDVLLESRRDIRGFDEWSDTEDTE